MQKNRINGNEEWYPIIIVTEQYTDIRIQSGKNQGDAHVPKKTAPQITN